MKVRRGRSSAGTRNLPGSQQSSCFANVRQSVTALGYTAGIFSGCMLRIVRLAPVSDDEEIPLEAPTPPVMTTDLAAALAQLLRSALARQAERSNRAA